MAEFLFQKGSPTYLQPENADVMNISHFMAQNLRQAPPPLPPKHTFEISEGESVEIEKIVAAEKKVSSHSLSFHLLNELICLLLYFYDVVALP